MDADEELEEQPVDFEAPVEGANEEVGEDSKLENGEDVAAEDDEVTAAEAPPPDTPLTQEMMKSSLSLLCKIGSGVQHAFVRIDLNSKGLTDIDCIKTYQRLRYVNIAENNLQDISQLCSLPELLSVDAKKNNITTVSLDSLPFLQEVNLSNNKITIPSGLVNPLMKTLNLSNNLVADVSVLHSAGLNLLTTLDLSVNQISNVSPLFNLKALTVLYLAKNSITSLDGIASLVHLKRLHLRGNAITLLDGFSSALAQLEYVNLRQNTVASMNEVMKLQCLPVLKAIVLNDNPVAEVSDYRMQMLVQMAQLVRLDKVPYEDTERKEAEFLAQELASKSVVASA